MFAVVFLWWSACAAAMSFSDNFDDGTLGGWIPKQGLWTNPGDLLLSSWDNYGVAWRAGSFGLDQRIEVDAYFDAGTGANSKTALIGLRGGAAGNINPYFDHAYWAYVRQAEVAIVSTYKAFDLVTLARTTGLDMPLDSWISIAFQVTGTGADTRLQLWVNGESMLDVIDSSGRPHDDGGHIALGASNHINRYIAYDNAQGWSQPIPEAATSSLLALGLGALLLKLRRSQSCAGGMSAADPPRPGTT
ncbi:MAG TPA: hypothetical protein VK876_09690 [Rubrivivax sp.]|nr:hypothetical protein [Rubrivivax sp.]